MPAKQKLAARELHGVGGIDPWIGRLPNMAHPCQRCPAGYWMEEGFWLHCTMRISFDAHVPGSGDTMKTMLLRWVFGAVLAVWGACVSAQTGPPPPPPEPLPIERLAHHNFFLGVTNDLAAWPTYTEPLQENLVFEQGAVYLNGLGRLGSGGYKLQTRNLSKLNYRSLSLSMRFMTESVAGVRPLLSGGVTRWMELRLEQGRLYLVLNGGAQSYAFPEAVRVEPGAWVSMAFSLDVGAARAAISLDGGPAQSVGLPSDLVLAVEAMGLDDRVFNFENTAFQARFAGWIKDLHIYSRALDDAELVVEAMPLDAPRFKQIVQPPAIGGMSIAAGTVLVVPAWNAEKPINVASRSPTVCVIENSIAARLLQPGNCQVEYQQQGQINPATTFVSSLSFTVFGLEHPSPAQTYTFSEGVLPASSIALFKEGGVSNFSLYALLNIGAGLMRSATRAEPSYNVYVLALLPSGALGMPVRPVLVKNSGGDWGPAALPLNVFIQNAQLNAVDNQVVLQILLNADMTSLSGTEFYVGYGSSDVEMLEARRFRGVYIVP